MTRMNALNLPTLSRRVYASLLNVYPSTYREEFGPDMTWLFEEMSRQAWVNGGTKALAALWLRTMADIGKTTVSEHLAVHKERNTPRLDRFEIRAEFDGGFAAVYQAYDPTLRRQVALKVAPTQSEDWDLAVHCFQRTAILQQPLSHPGLPRLYEAVFEGDRPYLVYEFIRGQNLRLLLDKRQTFFPARTVAEWGLQLCDALSYLHRRRPHPLAVRDIKPANVMLDDHGRIRLVDLGVLAETPRGWGELEAIGTEGFAAPEQYEREGGPVSDVYGVGATMHYLLTHVDPRREHRFTFSERPIREVNPTVSAELEAVIMTAVARDPAARFPSGAAMQKALLKALESLP